jgi:rare lipoprotein A
VNPRLLVLALPAVLLAACASPRAASIAPVAPVVGAEQRGLASWYGHPYHGRRTASGEVYDMHRMTAAHRTLPFGTWIEVENLTNGRAVEVRVNDRGPFVDGRVVDVSRAAAVKVDGIAAGVFPARLRVIPAPGAATAPSPAAAEAPAPGGYSVQVGAFADEERAARVQRALAEAGVEAAVQRVDGERVLYRVRTAAFASRDEARAHAERLVGLGYSPIVVAW